MCSLHTLQYKEVPLGFGTNYYSIYFILGYNSSFPFLPTYSGITSNKFHYLLDALANYSYF